MEILSLNGRWQVKPASQAETEWLAAEVPGCVHTDLLAAGKIPDPFYRDNEQQVLWIGETDWVYRRTFHVDEVMLAEESVLLHCAGLDTLATVWLNSVELGRADNMFRTWEFDAKPHLQPGENELLIQFDSPLVYGQKKLEERYIHSWSTDHHKLPGGNYVRKAQCHFGWDWGPQLVTCGIWRNISIIAHSQSRLSDVHIQQNHEHETWVRLNVDVALEAETAVPTSVLCKILLDGQEVLWEETVVEGKTAVFDLIIHDPQLWWPNGLGAQPLYDVQVTLLDAEKQTLDSWQKKIGLRTLELVREKDEWGESFHFACNGVPFFSKGANWIPADSFVTRLTDAHYTQLLQAAADTHMNMLRVWGGGIYEQDIFYELCDQLGICIWQDFMFACATYPTFDDTFMANVEQEVIENVKRLRHHASIALWCGNNELEQGLVQDSWSPWGMSWEDYGKLFDELMPELVAELDPETAYWPGSPHTPHDDRRDWNDPRWGDAHIWDVWHGKKAI